MTTPPDGGPAFPIQDKAVWTPASEDGEQVTHCVMRSPGMSLRDVFALGALVGMTSRGEFNARLAWSLADMMLAERGRTDHPG